MKLGRVAAIAEKEWREIVRDPIVVWLAFVLAPTLMVVLGYGLTQDVERVPLVIVDGDRTASSRDYAQHYIGSRHFDVQGYARHERDADRLLAAGRVRVVLVIPERFEEQLMAGRATEVQALVDGTFTPAARTVGAYVEAINAAVSEARVIEHLAQRLGVPPARAETLLAAIRVDVRYLYNQELRAVVGVAPSLIMFTLSLVAPILAALNVVRERESGGIYNVYASTVTRMEFLTGKLLPIVVVVLINALILWLMAMWGFGVPFEGNPLAFLAGTAVYVVMLGALGLVVSLIVRSQQAAVIVSMLLAMIVVFQFSGMLTPLASLTGPAWLLAQVLPASHYNTVAQGAFLKGRGAGGPWTHVAVILAHAVGLLAVAWLLFRKRVKS